MSIPKNCPKCKSENIEPITNTERQTGGKRYRLVWRCNDCGKEKRQTVKEAE